MGFEEFCGGEFWDLSVTWNTDDPHFTKCFERTVLAWIPAALLILITPFEVTSWQDSKRTKIPFTVLNVTKILLTLALVALCAAQMVILEGSGLTVADAEYVGSAVEACAYLYTLLLLALSLRNGCITSGPQLIFWFIDTVCRAVFFRTIAKEYFDESSPSKDDTDLFIIGVAHLVGSALMLLLNCFADKNTDQEFLNSRKPCPNDDSSFFNKLIYSWCTPLIWTGYKKPLTVTDLWDISPKISSKEAVPQFEAHYNATIESKTKKSANVDSAQFSPKNGSVTFVKDDKTKKPLVSVFPALVKTYGGSFMFGAILKLCCDLLNLASPKVMKLMISFVESYSDESRPSEEKWKGFFYGALLFCVVTLQSLMMSQYFESMFVIGVKVRTTLIATLYKKSLKISASAKKESTVGEIVNLMSVDVQKFMDLLPYANILWSALLQIGLSTYFIYEELGWPAFIGVAILVVSIPLNGYLAGLMRKFQLKQMKLKDKRIKLMNEILGGMKVLKLYAWEPSFINQIGTIRNDEIKVMKKAAYFQAFMSFFWTTAPFMVGLGSFTTYLFINGGQELTAQKAFVTLSYLNIMRIPLAMLPMMVAFMVQAKVSLDRVNKFMNNDELDENAVSHENDNGDAVSITEGTFKWGADEPTVLHNINMSVKKGALTAVVGTVGCGKSSLISAMLGEMHKESGVVSTVGKVAYVPQQAWIQNSTVKDNILFCVENNDKKYEDVIDACALRTDLEILPAGDQTEIGEKGINLSGGQKQRVSLARAVYSDSDVYLLDDPLSAVDSHVGKHIFENVIGPTGALKNTTRILVTHGITYLPKTDYIITMKEGRISEQGTYEDLIAQKGEFAAFMLEYMTEENEDTEQIKEELSKTLGEDFVKTQLLSKKSVTEPPSFDEVDGSLSKKGGETAKNEIEKQEKTEPVSKSKTAEKLIEKEVAETGSVKMKVYFYYMKCIGLIGTLAAVLGQAIYSSSTIMVSYWMTWWTSNRFGNASEPQYRDMYLGVYGGIGLLQSVVVMGYSAILALTTLNASKILHKKMLTRVMMSPMSFFDTTPLGRIVNRFAKDVDVCDTTLPGNLRSWLSTFAQFVGTIITIMTVVPLFIAVILPVAVVFFFIQKFYVNTSRQLKRLESISRSPIYSHFGETISGSSTIRAFGRGQDFILQSEAKVDANQIAYFPSIIANRWLAVRLELLGNLVTLGAAMFVIFSPETINPSQVGLVITYSLNITQTLNWLVRMTADVETNIVGVERIMEYSEIEQEAPWVYPTDRPGRDWPEHGEVEFEKYGLRYREGLDLVIKDITCKVDGGKKVGIVGRTGAGKSTLTVALFRMVESAFGSIKIDGRDISEIGLHDLRNKLTIIPQDPVLFSGTLRMNLDPFSAFSDQQIWAVLEQSHLKAYVTELELGLEHDVQEGGENLSVGQRQLVCLARALLRKTKVLILDEATAAVDLETDDLIQATIRKEFVDSTVLTIAHRLNTIMDYDKIMVLDKGLLVEYDTPNNLLDDDKSIFHGMAFDAGLTSNRNEDDNSNTNM